MLGRPDEAADTGFVREPVPVQTEPGLAGEELADRRVDPRLFDLSGPDGFSQPFRGGERVLGLQDDVVTRLDGLHRDLLGAEARHDLIVPQVIGGQDALEPEPFAKPPRHQLLLDTGREVGTLRDRRDGDVLAHDERHAGVDGVAESAEFLRFDVRGGLGDERESGTARHPVDVPPAREVLGRGQHAVVLIAPDVGTDHAPQEVHVAAEGPDAFRGILRIHGNVGDRRVGQMDAHRPALYRADRPDLGGQRLGTGRRKGHVRGELGRAGDLLAGAAFEVRRYEQGQGRFSLEPVEEAGGFSRRPAVDDEPADPELADEAGP